MISSKGASAVRFTGWFMLALGAAFLIGAAVLGIAAVQQAVEISAYHHARACPAGSSALADCLRTVSGTVAAVTESPAVDRIPAQWKLDVRTASTTLDLTFSSDSPMLGYAVDGNEADVTMWRGVPVSVATGGWSEPTTSVPETAFAGDLGNGEEVLGLGAFLLLAALAVRRNRRVGARTPMGPVAAAIVTALGLASLVVMIGGWALGGKPSRLGPDSAAIGATLVVVAGLSLWVGLRARGRKLARELARADKVSGHVDQPHTHEMPAPWIPPTLPPARESGPAVPLRARLRPRSWRRPLGALAIAWIMPGLTVAVLFGVFFTSHDGPAARAYKQAPACVGETNLDSCAGDFTAVINGVRAPANGGNGADVSFVTRDGVINNWAWIGQDSAAITRVATTEQRAHTLLRIRVWRRSIMGGEVGDGWYWAWGDPPGNTIPTIFLAVSFGLLLIIVRLRYHRRPAAKANWRRTLLDDVGLVLASTGSTVLLAYGFWPGTLLALATLVGLALSVRRSVRRRRWRPVALHSSS